ncbi:MAG TPA: CPBP family intramembrane glutamic endopeptidase [Flavitalea sp.]|nr:CPBP family intramembrane glutamic endopeptidase [Flavitalea sp.]
MKKIIRWIREYILLLDPRIFFPVFIFIAAGVFCNYFFHMNRRIGTLQEGYQYLAWYFIFLSAFAFPYLLYPIFGKPNLFKQSNFNLLLLLAPLLFSWKMVYDIDFTFAVAPSQNIYWNAVLYWPLKLLGITMALFLIWKWQGDEQGFYGFTLKNFKPQPYLMMLLIMVPLVAAASTQPDFLAVYPKMKNIAGLGSAASGIQRKILFELSYGSDFVTIELFFRGFLVLAFSKWAGRDAILPMAVFYCTIHFGKPMGECISSFFGGMILGVVTYHTRTIFGGLMVHLGIAWMMEIGGFIGNAYFF